MNKATNPALPILLVDDEQGILLSLETILGIEGLNNIITCQDSRQIMDILSCHQVEIMVLDLIMPYISGRELLGEVVDKFPEIPVIILTGTVDIDMAVQCIKLGAFDYIVKPVENGRILNAVCHALALRDLKRENQSLKQHLLSDKLSHPEAFAEIITSNKKMLSILKYVESISRSSQPVLITGETGVGKELIARAIHNISGLEGPFNAVNIAGLDDQVFSDTLFGHVKGAFTNADQVRHGLAEQSSGGTLFLDEIGDLSPASQTKLLRLIQDGEYLPLGLDKARYTNARIIASTNHDLLRLQETNTFRSDLFYRLRTHHIHLPPLRERVDDIPLLFGYFMERASKELNKQKPAVPEELYTLLGAYSFPGNVRELRALIFDAISSNSTGTLSLDKFKPQLSEGLKQSVSQKQETDDIPFFTSSNKLPTIKQWTEKLVKEAMKRSRGNQSVAASILGISQQALSKRLKNISH